MESHLRILAAFHLVLGALGLLGESAFVLIFDVVHTTAPADATDMAARLMVGIMLLIIPVLSILSLGAGYGLLQRAEWARILTRILSVLHLPNLPLGTLLGIYGLWVLRKPQTLALFQHDQAAR